MNRRVFLRNSIFSLTAFTLLGALKSTSAWAADLIKMKKDGSADHAQAKGLGYVADLSAALKNPEVAKAAGLDIAKKKTNKGVKPEAQTCATCQFYAAKDKKSGTCTLIPGVLVHSDGSCNTWVPKA